MILKIIGSLHMGINRAGRKGKGWEMGKRGMINSAELRRNRRGKDAKATGVLT